MPCCRLIASGQGCRTVQRWAEPFFPVLTLFPAGAGRSRNMLSAQSLNRYEKLTKPDTLMESGNVHFLNNIYYSTFLGLIKGEFKLFAFL
jgi:hypothetical protein